MSTSTGNDGGGGGTGGGGAGGSAQKRPSGADLAVSWGVLDNYKNPAVSFGSELTITVCAGAGPRLASVERSEG